MGWQLEHDVIVAVDREMVWAFHSDVENWRRVEGDAIESIELDGPFQAGMNGITKMPGQAPTRWRLIEVEPPRLTVIETQMPDAVLRVTWRFEALSQNRTRMTQKMMLVGGGAEALVPMMDEYFAENIEAGMEKMADEITKFAAHQSPGSPAQKRDPM